MKKLFRTSIILILSYTFNLNVSAQDVIVKTSGEEIKAKVTEIGISEIKYKKFENLDGPIMVISKSEVFKINYENGTFELITQVGMQDTKKNTSKYKSRREAGWSFFFSFLYPGIGQFYNKQPGKGIPMFIGYTVASTIILSGVLPDYETWPLILTASGGAAIWLWSVIDAPVSSSMINKKYDLTSFDLINNNKLNLNLTPNIKPMNMSLTNNHQNYGLSYGASLKIKFK